MDDNFCLKHIASIYNHPNFLIIVGLIVIGFLINKKLVHLNKIIRWRKRLKKVYLRLMRMYHTHYSHFILLRDQ